MAYTTIDDPSAHFHTQLYTGDGNSTQAITNDGNSDLQPDWIWTKQRSHAVGHNLTDSSRGASKALFSESTDAEDTGGNISSFDSDGFTTTDANRTNQSGRTFVAWQWKANGGTTSSNSNGSITSTVQANTTAGFSIVTYTGTGSTATVGHSLGVIPSMIIIKSRNTNSRHWSIYHSSLGATKYVFLDDTDAAITSASRFNDTAPTSSVFTVHTDGDVNGSGTNHVAYCFHSVKGYSKFGKYKGNGDANGPFIHLGFRPAFFILKRYSSTGNWLIYDNKRDTFNEALSYLVANTTDANSTAGDGIDFLSNGVKIRRTGVSWNGDGDDYLFMAFAEHPFVTSKGTPAQAR